MNYLTETKHEAMGQRQQTDDHGKVIFVSLFFGPSYIYPKCKHALWKKPTIKCSEDDLVLFDDQRQKSARIINLIFAITMEWISPVKHREQNR